MSNPHLSSKYSEWATPQDFFDTCHAEFAFTLDVCANEQNAKCERYFTPQDDALSKSWAGNVCWMNPPYGKELPKWLEKAHFESTKGATVVCLIPSRTDTRWWHKWVMQGEIRFIKGRLRFVNSSNGFCRTQTSSVLDGRHAPNAAAPFPTALVIFGQKQGIANKSYNSQR